MAFAIGQMGLSRDDYLDSTPSEFKKVYDNWIKRIQSQQENDLWQRMMVGRLIAFRVVCPPKGKKMGKETMMNITDFWQLPGEDEIIKKQREKQKSTRARFDELVRKWG